MLRNASVQVIYLLLYLSRLPIDMPAYPIQLLNRHRHTERIDMDTPHEYVHKFLYHLHRCQIFESPAPKHIIQILIIIVMDKFIANAN